jgi:hypothetical protein
MKLLTQEIRKSIPALYATEQIPENEKKIAVKFFTPWASWTWYAVEGGPVYDDESSQEVDFEFFGLVDGDFKEWGYFTLNQLQEVKGPFGLAIERDMYFDNQTIGKVKGE